MSVVGQEAQPTTEHAPRSTAEWVSLLLSLVIIAGVVGAVLMLWISPAATPARFAVETGTVRVEGDQYYLPVTLKNEGDLTAAQVTLVGVVPGGEQDEQISVTFDFVAGHSSSRAVLIFRSDPSSARLRVVSYEEP